MAMRHGLRRLHQHGAAPDRPSRTRRACPMTMDDWDAASARTPQPCVHLRPPARATLIDLYAVRRRAGGHGRARAAAACWTQSALTCTGTSGRVPGRDAAARATATVCRTRENPYSARRAASRCCAATWRPTAAVVKKSGGRPRPCSCTPGPPACSTREEEACEAILRRQDQPRATWWSSATRARPAAPACARCSRPPAPSAAWAFASSVALITDGRFSGASKGPCRRSREPRGRGRRPHRAHLHEGDISRPSTSRAARLDAERERRRARAPAARRGSRRRPSTTAGVLAKYAKLVTSADKGAMHPVSDIDDSTAAASAATPAEGKPTTPVSAQRRHPRRAPVRARARPSRAAPCLAPQAVVASLEAEGGDDGVRLPGRPGHQALRRAVRLRPDHPRARPPRAGRRAHGRRLRPLHRATPAWPSSPRGRAPRTR